MPTTLRTQPPRRLPGRRVVRPARRRTSWRTRYAVLAGLPPPPSGRCSSRRRSATTSSPGTPTSSRYSATHATSRPRSTQAPLVPLVAEAQQILLDRRAPAAADDGQPGRSRPRPAAQARGPRVQHVQGRRDDSNWPCAPPPLCLVPRSASVYSSEDEVRARPSTTTTTSPTRYSTRQSLHTTQQPGHR